MYYPTGRFVGWVPPVSTSTKVGAHHSSFVSHSFKLNSQSKHILVIDTPPTPYQAEIKEQVNPLIISQHKSTQEVIKDQNQTHSRFSILEPN